MQKFTAIIHEGGKEEGGFWATCLEVPGANGQGETPDECLKDLGEAVKLILEINREEAHSHDPNAREMELCVA